MIEAINTFLLEPVRHRRFGLAWYRLSQLLHERTNGAFDAAYMWLLRRFPRKLALPEPATMSPVEIADTVALLRRDGYATMPFHLSQAEIDELCRFAYGTPAHGMDYERPIAVAPNNIPPGEPRYSWWMQDLVRLPVVQRLIADGPYSALAQEYLGCRPTLAHVTLFLDCPHPEVYTAHTYHCDNEGPGFLKFFFYLTDVDTTTGAHHFIRGSHDHVKPKRFAKATFYKDDDLLGHYGRDRELVITGEAGSVFAEDTAGFHRGSAIAHHHRLVLQLEYSVIDVPTEYELRRPLLPVTVPGLHPGIASVARKFFKAA